MKTKLIKISLILAISLLTVACGKYQPVEQDPAFTQSLDEYHKETGKYTYRLDIRLTDLGDKESTCVRATQDDDRSFVKIDQTKYNYMDPLRQKALVYKMIGECVLNKDIQPVVYNDDGCETSLLNDSITSTWCLYKYWDSYVANLIK